MSSRLIFLLAVLLVAAACAGSVTGKTSAQDRSAPVVRVTEHADGRTVALKAGQRLVVVLHSTYWEFAGSSNPAVLSPRGKPTIRPKRSGCVPGGGCGTVTAAYVAKKAGRATVKADRTSCGEAMGCTKAASAFELHVRVAR